MGNTISHLSAHLSLFTSEFSIEVHRESRGCAATSSGATAESCGFVFPKTGIPFSIFFILKTPACAEYYGLRISIKCRPLCFSNYFLMKW